MKIKIWPDDTTVPEMDEWLAELRDEGRPKPSGTNGAEPSGATGAESSAATEPFAAAEAFGAPVAAAVSVTPAEPVMAEAPAEPAASPESAPDVATVRPLIGDQLRMPIIWCEMGSCISWHADSAALGEGDARARAIAAGWRLDAFDRMACPPCQQTDPGFRNPYPVVPWDRHTALARAARAAAARGGAHNGAHAPGR